MQTDETTCDDETRRCACALYERYAANTAGPSWLDLPTETRSQWCAVALATREIAQSAWHRGAHPFGRVAYEEKLDFTAWWKARP